MLDKIFNKKSKVEFNGVCPTCTAYLVNCDEIDSKVKCNDCESSVDLHEPSCLNQFLVIDSSSTISQLITNDEDYYYNLVNEHKFDEQIRDIYGKAYLDLVSSLPKEDRFNYATCVINSDGAPAFKWIQYSIWPVYLMVNELPVSDRFENLITIGLWFGKNKPSMSVYFVPIVDMLNNLATLGIQCTTKKEIRRLKLFTLVCCVDTIARARMKGGGYLLNSTDTMDVIGACILVNLLIL